MAFVENFVKDHFLPAMFVDYRKAVQQAISSKSIYMLHSLLANESYRSCIVQCLLVKTQYRDFNGKPEEASLLMLHGKIIKSAYCISCCCQKKYASHD